MSSIELAGLEAITSKFYNSSIFDSINCRTNQWLNLDTSSVFLVKLFGE